MTARIILALVMLLIAGCYLTWRMIGTGGGQHAAPRSFTRADEWPAPAAERVVTVPRAAVMSAPPWDDVPPPAPITGGLTPVHPALPGYVVDAIGHDGDSDAAVESMWTRILARQLNEKIAGGEL